MKYKGSYFDMWDTWYLNVNDTIHAFHLKSHAGEDWNIGHIKSDDMLHFKKLRDVLEPLPEEEYPDDCLGKFTGCAVEKDGIYYLFYTMRDRYRSEKIGLATSTDLKYFKEYENNPVLVPDKTIFSVYPKGEKTDCRDMLVVHDEERKKYFGYFAAMADIQGRGVLGVIGVAESTNLIDWNNQKIVYIPDFNGVVEVPNVFKIDGKWYMTLMTSTQYGAKGAVSDINLNSYIIWAVSNTPDGMFKCEKDNVFLGSTLINNGYALRCVDFKGKKYAMYIDRSEYGAAISLPKEVKVKNGILNPYYTDILKNIRTGKKYENPHFIKEQSNFAWRMVSAGEINNTENNIKITGYKNSLQTFRANEISVNSMEAEFNISGNFSEAGFVLFCSSEDFNVLPKDDVLWNSYMWNAYYISLCKDEHVVMLNEGMVNPICKRNFNFKDITELHIRIIAMEGQLELYIDDVLFIQCGIKTEKYISPGLFVFSGDAEIKNFKVYELEN